MTEIHLHGILGKKYGKKHYLSISKPKDLIFAMEANYDDFIKDLKELAKKNIHYTFVIDNQWSKTNPNRDIREAKTLDFVPVILGSGWTAVAFALAIGSAVYSYVQAGKVEYPKIPGAAMQTNAMSKSLAFSNRDNIAEQGNPVPLVYGRIKIGSYVIQTSVKSFPLSVSLNDEIQSNSLNRMGNQGDTISAVNNNNVLKQA